MSTSTHIKAMQAILDAPFPPKTVEAARAFASAEEAYHQGEFQKCLDILASLCKCGTPVTDGVNGYVSPPPPWAENDPHAVCCYACENRAEADADKAHFVEQVDAALRAGLFKLV